MTTTPIEKYYLKADHQTEWDEVTREQFIAACSAAGFRSKFGSNHPATGGFSGNGMRGRIEYITEHNQHSSLIAQRERLLEALREMLNRFYPHTCDRWSKLCQVQSVISG